MFYTIFIALYLSDLTLPFTVSQVSRANYPYASWETNKDYVVPLVNMRRSSDQLSRGIGSHGPKTGFFGFQNLSFSLQEFFS